MHDIEAGQVNPAAAGPPLTDENAQGAALAGAVGTEQAEKLARAKFQREIVDGRERAVAHAEVLERKDWGGAHEVFLD
jgi:hypothetical protein